MMSLFNWLDRWALSSQLKIKQAWLRRRATRSPDEFRRLARLNADLPETVAEIIQPWQRLDFQALDAAWLQLAGRRIAARTRAWIERPRGHSKTSDIALQIAWILLSTRRPLHGIAAAADRDQAALVAEALQRFARVNAPLCDRLVFQKHLIANRDTGARLSVISSDVQSSWGQLPDFVICDELCHWEKPDMWYSLLSSAAKQPRCLLVVLTNAGVGRDWHWQAREAARESPRWHFSTLDGPQAPWITPEILHEQQQLLPRPVFARLWLNQWQHSDGEFVTLSEAEACRDPNLAPQRQGVPGRHYFAAIDYAEKRDYTVAVLLHAEGLSSNDRIVVDRLDVVVPSPESPTPVAWVEDWIRAVAAEFRNVTFILDEYQLVGVIQTLERTVDLHRFGFSAGKGNHALALNLRNLILHRRIAWYPGCGQLSTPGTLAFPNPQLGRNLHGNPWDPPAAGSLDPISNLPRDDLETELASLLYRQSPAGLCRIDHKSGHHDDRSFALGAAALFAVKQAPPDLDLTIIPPTSDGDFRWS